MTSSTSELQAAAGAAAPQAPQVAPNRILWVFALGQLGWSMMLGIINNWLVYFYQPGESALGQAISMAARALRARAL
ncbi:MAG: hypothetical protein Q4E12_06080, partial [Coriobacteriia bacterium]|nr:hypothetical protein [Coriobacteriia bacterium]